MAEFLPAPQTDTEILAQMIMNCTICKQGETQPGTTTITLEHSTTTLVVKALPAQICNNCGESYMLEETTVALLAMLNQSATNSVVVEA